jgi:transcriptional regulator with XRE-family HTH domain
MTESTDNIHPLKQWRLSKDLNQEEAGEMVGISRVTFRRLENAERMPEPLKMPLIQEVTGLDANTFTKYYNLINCSTKTAEHPQAVC